MKWSGGLEREGKRCDNARKMSPKERKGFCGGLRMKIAGRNFGAGGGEATVTAA